MNCCGYFHNADSEDADHTDSTDLADSGFLFDLVLFQFILFIRVTFFLVTPATMNILLAIFDVFTLLIKNLSMFSVKFLEDKKKITTENKNKRKRHVVRVKKTFGKINMVLNIVNKCDV